MAKVSNALMLENMLNFYKQKNRMNSDWTFFMA